MTTLPATMQNAYLAQGFRPCYRWSGPPCDVLATMVVMRGDRLDLVLISELAAWCEEDVSGPVDWRIPSELL